jgi:hypothetical protein
LIDMKWLYLVAALVGIVLPLSFLVPFVTAQGLNLPLFFGQLFQNNVSAFFAMDVLVSAITLWVLVFSEGRKRGMRNLWVYVLCTLLVGVSLALPLFLFNRERVIGTKGQTG